MTGPMTIAHVYFIQSGGTSGPIKIGITKGSVEKRLAQLQKANPRELRLLSVIYNAHPYVEAHLHGQFAPGLIRGEWFNANTPGLGELIRDVKAGVLPARIQEIIEVQRGYEASGRAANRVAA